MAGISTMVLRYNTVTSAPRRRATRAMTRALWPPPTTITFGAKLYRLTGVDHPQESDRAEDIGRILSLDSEPDTLMGADTNENFIKIG